MTRPYNFNPRSSCEERRPTITRSKVFLFNFNPRSSCEERRKAQWYREQRGYFNPRSSCEERQWDIVGKLQEIEFQSTLLMRGATPRGLHYLAFLQYFNPRSSCEERPAKCRVNGHISKNFNPRSSCEERRDHRRTQQALPHISIHAPHARSDSIRAVRHWSRQKFQSTLLMRGATGDFVILRGDNRISIHAPHARSDVHYMMLEANYSIFQSTLLMRGATGRNQTSGNSNKISIHAPHARSDVQFGQILVRLDISIHAPHARSDNTRHDFLIKAL